MHLLTTALFVSNQFKDIVLANLVFNVLMMDHAKEAYKNAQVPEYAHPGIICAKMACACPVAAYRKNVRSYQRVC